MRPVTRPAVLLLCAVLTACSSYDVALSTTSDVQVDPGPRDSISDVSVTDARDGSQASTRASAVPITDVVAASVRAGLARRMMLAPGAPYRMEVTLTRLDATNTFGADARVAMRLAVLDRANRVVYRAAAGDAGAGPSSGSATGTAADFVALLLIGRTAGPGYVNSRNNEVQDALQHTLGVVTDRLLDNVKLWNAISPPPA